jgi:hypothetical protein
VNLAAIDLSMRSGRYDEVCTQVDLLLTDRGRLSDAEVAELNDRWQLAALRKALAVTEPAARYVVFTDLDQDPHFAADNPRKRLVQQEIAKIAEHPLVLQEQAVIAVYKGLKEKEQRYASYPTRLAPLIAQYQNLAKRFPDSPTALKAAADAERLGKRVN